MSAVQCVPSCRWHFKGHTDAAKRISDALNLAWTFSGWDGTVGKWMAFRLSDGTTDHAIYDTKRDAVIHVGNEFHYCFFKMQPMGCTVCQAEIMLWFTRTAIENGFRLADPDKASGGPDIIPRIGHADVFAQLRSLKGG